MLPTKHAKTQGYPSQYLQAHRDGPIALLSPGDRWFREILDTETRSWGFIMFQLLKFNDFKVRGSNWDKLHQRLKSLRDVEINFGRMKTTIRIHSSCFYYIPSRATLRKTAPVFPGSPECWQLNLLQLRIRRTNQWTILTPRSHAKKRLRSHAMDTWSSYRHWCLPKMPKWGL